MSEKKGVKAACGFVISLSSSLSSFFLFLSHNQSFNGALILIHLLPSSFAPFCNFHISHKSKMHTRASKIIFMDNSPSPILNSEEIPAETQASKKRKMSQKTVLTLKIEENENGKQKSEGPPPADCWSWRKYGQKPIKGSPYPRGYYKCSTSKGCSAKKQVERCRTDASLLIITYTSTHNHPSPKEPKQEPPKIQITEEDNNLITPEENDFKEEDEKDQQSLNGHEEDGARENITDFHYCQSPFNSSDDIIINIRHEEESTITENLQTVLFDEKEKPLCYPHLMTFSTPKSEENDFYDELGELPPSTSYFTSFMRGNFFEDRILVHLS